MFSLRGRLGRRLRPLRRAVLARRRLLAAIFAAVAVAAGIHAAAAPPPPMVGVSTAARDLPAGRVIGADDLVEVDFAPGSVPAGLAPDSVGRMLAAPLRHGEPVTDVRLVGPALAQAYPGLTALPVRLPDAGMVELLRVGDRIDLIATDPQRSGASVVSAGVPVLAIPAVPARTDAAGQGGRLVVIGADPRDVARVSEASVRLFLTYAFVR